MDIASILGIAFGSAGLGGIVTGLITFFVTRKDKKKGLEELTKKNSAEIEEVKREQKLIKAMCLGSLYDRTKFLGEHYIDKGCISMSEYSDWNKYLYEPYHDAGGNGTIEKIKQEIDKLPIEG